MSNTTFNPDEKAHFATLLPDNANIKITIWVLEYPDRDEIDSLYAQLSISAPNKELIVYPFSKYYLGPYKTIVTFSIPVEHAYSAPPFEMKLFSNDENVDISLFKFSVEYDYIEVS